MLNAHISFGLVAPLLFVLNTTPSEASSIPMRADTAVVVKKCRNAMQAKPLYYVDGHVISADSSAKIKSMDLRYVTVTCLNLVDSTFLSPSSTLPGTPLVSVWTTNGPFARVEPALKAIVEAQSAMFTASGSYNRDVVKQPLPVLPSNMKMKFQSTATGWEVTVWLDQALSPRCHTFGGDNTSGGVDAITKQPIRAGEIVCSDS